MAQDKRGGQDQKRQKNARYSTNNHEEHKPDINRPGGQLQGAELFRGMA